MKLSNVIRISREVIVKNKGFKIVIEKEKPRAIEKIRMDLSTSPKIFGSKKDYNRKQKYKKDYMED